jgi:hypothetical protein
METGGFKASDLRVRHEEPAHWQRCVDEKRVDGRRSEMLVAIPGIKKEILK